MLHFIFVSELANLCCFCLVYIRPFVLPVPLYIWPSCETKVHLSSPEQWVVGVTKNMLWINEMPLSTMLFLHGWSFRLKCHCLCSFSLMFLLNFTHLTCSVHKIWIILTGFTRPPCVSTCTHVIAHASPQHLCDVYRGMQRDILWWHSEKLVNM